jgi:AcrR family transcriptional regulator
VTSSTPALRATRRRMSAEERRQQIITEAATLFDDAGYTHATVDDIARRVGVAKPTIYHYFESKDEILQAIHEEFIDLLITRHEQRAMIGRAPEELLLEIMVDVLDLMETHRGHVRVFFEHHRHLAPQAQGAMRVKRDDYERTVEELFVNGVRRGAFKPLDPVLATLATFGMCNWAYQWYQPGGELRPRQIAEQFWTFLMCGVGTSVLTGSLDAAASDPPLTAGP